MKELKRQALAPKGLDRSEVRKLLREVELRQDTRLSAIFNLFLFTGCRVGDLIGLELNDLMISERSGSVVFRNGKGNKQRSVPSPLIARRTLQSWLEARPQVGSPIVFIGECGPLTDRGVRNLCDKYVRFADSNCIRICCGTRWLTNSWPAIPMISCRWPRSSAMRI